MPHRTRSSSCHSSGVTPLASILSQSWMVCSMSHRNSAHATGQEHCGCPALPMVVWTFGNFMMGVQEGALLALHGKWQKDYEAPLHSSSLGWASPNGHITSYVLHLRFLAG